MRQGKGKGGKEWGEVLWWASKWKAAWQLDAWSVVETVCVIN